MEARLSWTLFGKNSSHRVEPDAALMVVSVLMQDANLSELWALDILGVMDLMEGVSKRLCEEEFQVQFREPTNVNNEGRYEVILPWKENSPPLRENRYMAEKRSVTVSKKIPRGELFDEYDIIVQKGFPKASSRRCLRKRSTIEVIILELSGD